MVTMFKTENLPINQTIVHIANKLHQNGYCVFCNAHMHSQRTGSGEWHMVCFDGQHHTNPICDNMYKNHKTILEWRNENWGALFESMDHEDHFQEEKLPIDVSTIDNIDPNGKPDDESADDEEIGISDTEFDPDDQHGKGREPIKITHRPPRTMSDVVNCGVLFLLNLGAMIANGTRIGDRITSYIDRKWMTIAIFASLLHIPSGFLSVPSPTAYHAFQFVPTCITRSIIEGTIALYFNKHQIYINLKVRINPTLPSNLKKQLGNGFAMLRKKCLVNNPMPTNEYDHFLASELLVVSGKWHMVMKPHVAGKFLRATFETTIRSKDQIALCSGAMKWLKSQGEEFNGINIK